MDLGTVAALIIFAAVVGAYGTIIGAGGGFLLIPGLVLLFDLDGAAAVGTGSVTLLVIGASGAVAYDRRGLVDRRAAVWFASGSLPVALLCGLVVASRIDRDAFADLLGILLLGLAVFVVCMPTQHRVHDVPPDAVPRPLPPAGAFVGFLSGTFAVGGGLVSLPILARIRGLEPHRAAATTSVSVAVTANERGRPSAALRLGDWKTFCTALRPLQVLFILVIIIIIIASSHATSEDRSTTR